MPPAHLGETSVFRLGGRGGEGRRWLGHISYLEVL